MKYTKDLLEPLVKTSVSFAEVIRKLGLRQAGGTYSHICRVIKRFQLDTSHFLGRAANRGPNKKGGPKRLTWQEILVPRKHGNRQKSRLLRRALVESGRKYECEECGQLPIWNNKPLVLEVDHKDRNWLDDSPENVRFLCPHCHSQTVGYNNRLVT